MAVTIEDPLSSLNIFFTAVLMVIVGTYLLFQAGSVFICKLLKKNKKYYYDPRHFVPVSGMIYRMKRNGAGLATICILATMVMVMLGSTGSLFFGLNSAIDKMYPYDININSVGISNYEEWKSLSPDMLNKDILEVFDYIKPEDVHFERYENFVALKICFSHMIPPSPYAFNRKLSCIMVTAKINKSCIIIDNINSIWRNFSKFSNFKIMVKHFSWITFFPVFLTTIHKIAYEFFFLCIG